jgi:hypothetical protein
MSLGDMGPAFIVLADNNARPRYCLSVLHFQKLFTY